MKKYILTAFVICSCWLQTFSQSVEEKTDSTKMSPETEKIAKAAASLINAKKTANSKDILTTLFRASVENLLKADHVYSLNSSFFAIDSLLRKKDNPLSYERERILRHNSFNFGLTAGDNNNINKISGGLTVTLLDKRDIKSERYKNGEFDKLIYTEQVISGIKRGLRNYLAISHPELYNGKDIKGLQAIDDSWNTASKNHDFSNLHPLITQALTSKDFDKSMPSLDGKITVADFNSIKGDIINGFDPLHQEYENVAKAYAQKPLWTFSPTASYDIEHKQGEYSLASNFTVGIGKSTQKPWEFEVKSQFKIANDSTLTYSNYNDKPLSISVGINKVLCWNKDKESKMELKFFTQYNYQFGNALNAEEIEVYTLNTTLRINLYKSLWLPITLKYDADKGKIFGLFTLTANLDN